MDAPGRQQSPHLSRGQFGASLSSAFVLLGLILTGQPSPDPETRFSLQPTTATAAELDLVDGVGPILAQRIVTHRTEISRFERVEDLLRVPGVGPSHLEAFHRQSTALNPPTDRRE